MHFSYICVILFLLYFFLNLSDPWMGLHTQVFWQCSSVQICTSLTGLHDGPCCGFGWMRAIVAGVRSMVHCYQHLCVCVCVCVWVFEQGWREQTMLSFDFPHLNETSWNSIYHDILFYYDLASSLWFIGSIFICGCAVWPHCVALDAVHEVGDHDLVIPCQKQSHTLCICAHTRARTRMHAQTQTKADKPTCIS